MRLPSKNRGNILVLTHLKGGWMSKTQVEACFIVEYFKFSHLLCAINKYLTQQINWLESQISQYVKYVPTQKIIQYNIR